MTALRAVIVCLFAHNMTPISELASPVPNVTRLSLVVQRKRPVGTVHKIIFEWSNKYLHV